MKSNVLLFIGSFLLLGLASCTPGSQVKKAIEEDPSIVFSAIEKDPEGFMKAVQSAGRKQREQEESKREEAETKARDEEFSKPRNPVVDNKRAIFGKADAPVTIVEYTDYQCPFCSKGFQTIEEVRKAYGDKVRVLVKNLPLDFHPKAMPAAKYYEAVALQSTDKAEQFYKEVFTNQESLVKDGEKYLDQVVKKVGADLAKVKKDINGDEVKKRIDADMAEAREFGFNGTPGFLINGVSLRGAYPVEEFKTIIDRHLAKK